MVFNHSRFLAAFIRQEMYQMDPTACPELKHPIGFITRRSNDNKPLKFSHTGFGSQKDKVWRNLRFFMACFKGAYVSHFMAWEVSLFLLLLGAAPLLARRYTRSLKGKDHLKMWCDIQQLKIKQLLDVKTKRTAMI